ncbi:unnamed protein product [Ilex paraguariensis]|uniref:WAT1-related protein n=1 Tax=Ilex paraguariensis TaxID=185542 RepID=A0ABC8R2R8_9AQUA
MAMGLFYYGLQDATATYVTNFLNLIPIVTFVFSTVLGIEKLGLHTRAGKIKAVGATLCLAGALTITLYKGKSFHFRHHSIQHHSIIKKSKPNWTRGTLFLVGSILSYGAWFNLQSKLFKVFPYKYMATTVTCLIASLQQAAVGLCLDHSMAAWRLRWNLQLITIVYSGALATAVSFCLISWEIAKRGPTYPSIFNPLSLIFVAVFKAIFLGEGITIGSILGMALIIGGLYSFLWGRSRESTSKSLPTIAVESADADMTVPEPAGLQSAARMVPTASISSNDQVGDSDKNQRETLKSQ